MADESGLVKAADDIVAFVLGPPRSGKSSAGAILAPILGTDSVDTSAIIAEHYEQAHGLRLGGFVAARDANPELHRGVLGAWGTRLASRNGWCAARIAVARGFGVICGTRRLTELIAAEREAVRRGLVPWPVYLDRPGTEATDNTDLTLRQHAARSGSVVRNDDDLDRLEEELRSALTSFISRRIAGRLAGAAMDESSAVQPQGQGLPPSQQ